MDEKRFIRVVWLIKAALVVVLACAGLRAITGHLDTGAFDPETVSGGDRLPEVEPVPVSPRSTADYTEILQAKLFSGANDAVASARAPNLDSMPSAEELGLRLVGTLAGGPAISRANIQNIKSKTTGVYRIGDTIDSATVEAIQQDAVVLRHQGRQLILRLHTGAPGGDKEPGGKADSQTGKKVAPAEPRSALPPVKADYVAEVLRKATIEPYVKNNRAQGLRITGLDKIPMAEMFGLRNGDVIQSVNGQQLTSKQKAFQVLMKARTQSKVDIQLLRNGKSKDLSFGL